MHKSKEIYKSGEVKSEIIYLSFPSTELGDENDHS